METKQKLSKLMHDVLVFVDANDIQQVEIWFDLFEIKKNNYPFWWKLRPQKLARTKQRPILQSTYGIFSNSVCSILQSTYGTFSNYQQVVQR